MKLNVLYLSAMMACFCGVTTSQTPLKTYSVYDVNHSEETSVTDATLVVSRAVQQVTDDPQVVDASLLNTVLQEIYAKLEAMNARLEAMEQKLESINPDIPDTPDVPDTPDTPDTPNANGHEYVDLGMTDANGNPVYWATCNIGAEKPEDAGLYFAWGETQGYGRYAIGDRSFDWSTYKWCEGTSKTLTKYCTRSSYGTVDNKTVLDPEDDAAHVNWGGDWRMPTVDELDWLYENCTCQWDSSKNGSIVTSSKTGKSIFLPAAGYRINSDPISVGSYGYYWSSSVSTTNTSGAYILTFYSDDDLVRTSRTRQSAQSVRAVCVLSE